MRVVTFYSFKGGVGRTSLATNIAGLLADAHQRVLLVDFDLEAPGLSYLACLRPPGASKLPRGIAGYLADSWQARQSQEARRYLYDLEGFAGRLAVMPAGDVDGHAFAADSRTLREADFFREATRDSPGLALLYDLRKQWEQDFDYVLLDSRTGFTEIGGVCTRLLPDVVVAVLTLNEQGRKGTAQILRQVRGESLYGFALKTQVVASMIPGDWVGLPEELDKLSAELDVAAADVERLPLTVRLLIGEQPWFYRDGPADDSLRTAYHRIATTIRVDNPSDLEFRVDQASAALSVGKDPQHLLHLLADLMREPPAIPVPRLLGAVNDAALALVQWPGPLETRVQRRLLAVAAIQSVLGNVENARERYPRAYAGTQVNRGNILREVAGLPGEDRRGRLLAALAAFDAALTHYAPDVDPLDYAIAQNNRGIVLAEMAALPGEDRRARLLAALAALDAAVAYSGPQGVPAPYRGTQNNRGIILQDLAEFPEEERRSRLLQALAAYDAALERNHPEAAPLDYAATEANRGTVLRDLAVLPGEEARARLLEALAAHDAVLDQFHPDIAPLEHAMAQGNRGITLRDLAALPGEDRRARLLQALAAHDAALAYYRPEVAPLEHAMALNNRGLTLRDLATLPGEDRRGRLLEALRSGATALAVFHERQHEPHLRLGMGVLRGTREAAGELFPELWAELGLGEPPPWLTDEAEQHSANGGRGRSPRARRDEVRRPARRGRPRS